MFIYTLGDIISLGTILLLAAFFGLIKLNNWLDKKTPPKGRD